MIGAAIAAAVYEVAGGMLFPFDKTGDPVAESGWPGCFAHALVDLFAALGVAALAAAPGPVTRPPAAEPVRRVDPSPIGN